MRRLILTAITVVSFSACETGDPNPRLSLFVGVDISGSFTKSPYYDDAIEFLSHYLYAHLHGIEGMEVPHVLFVSSIGGASPNEPKTFYPKQVFENKSVPEIGMKLREIFPKTEENPYTDYNAFFEQIAMTVRNRKLVLRPITIVMVTDGKPDVRTEDGAGFRGINLKPLETLSRNITLRILYTSPETGKNWQTKVRRTRVKVWTQDAEVMTSWKDPSVFVPDRPLEEQRNFVRWIADNVNYGVAGRRVD